MRLRREKKQAVLLRGIPDLQLHLRSYYSPLFSFFCRETKGPQRTDLLSQILSSYCRRSPSPAPPDLTPTHCFIQPPPAFIHCGFAPLFFKPTAHRRDPYQNTVETEHNRASGGGGGEYTGRRVDDTMQVIHAEVLLRATTLDLQSFFWCS